MTVGDLLAVIENGNSYIEIKTSVYDKLDIFEWFDRAKYSKYFDCEVNNLDVRFESEWGDTVTTYEISLTHKSLQQLKYGGKL